MKTAKATGMVVTLFLGMIIMVGAASSTPLSFFNITNNNAYDASSAGQFAVDVIQVGAQAKFVFTNVGAIRCSITDVYFDDDNPPILSGIASIGGVGAVDFTANAAPPNLPGGSAYSFTATYSADSDSPIVWNGVNNSGLESLSIIFNIASGSAFSDLLTALGTGDFRVGLHVQGYKSGGSEAFLNNPGGGSLIPEPTTVGLLAAGLVSLAGTRRRRRS
jgi:hypothetical protein